MLPTCTRLPNKHTLTADSLYLDSLTAYLITLPTLTCCQQLDSWQLDSLQLDSLYLDSWQLDSCLLAHTSRIGDFPILPRFWLILADLADFGRFGRFLADFGENLAKFKFYKNATTHQFSGHLSHSGPKVACYLACLSRVARFRWVGEN